MLQRNFIAGVAFALLAFATIFPAKAQFLNPDTPLCNGAPCFTSGNPGSVSGTFSASLGGFTPSASGARMTPLSVTTADSSGSLPTGAVTVVSNVGTTNPMYCNVNGVAATTSDQLIGANSWFAFTIPATITTLHCIATGGTTTANGVGGAGLPTGAGGGGGGGGSSGVVFGPTAVGSAAANPPVLIAGTANAGATGNVQVAKVSASGLVSVDGSAVTQPVSASSLPLPTGASTAALQPTNAAQGSTTSGQTGHLIEGAVTTASPTYTTAQTSPLSLDTTGALRVNVTAGGAGGGAVTMASGAVASGAYSAGAYAAGAVVAGAFVDGWDATQGTKADTAWVSGSGSVIAILKNIAGSAAGSVPAGTAIIGKVGIDQTTPGTTNGVQVNAALPAGTNLMGKVGIDQTTPGTTNGVQVNAALPAGTNAIGNLASQYPGGAVPLTASATGTTAATTATLAGTTGKTTFICGYSIRANATANANVTDTITGVISGTMSSALWVPANTAGLGVDEQIFTPCIPASATNTAIAAVSGAPGTGGVVTVKAWGYQL